MSQFISPGVLNAEDAYAIIDVRTCDEYAREHIAGSVNIPLDQILGRFNEIQAMASPILSCRSGQRAQEAARLLEKQGKSGLRLLEGGILGWKRAGKPVVSVQGGISVMRQVQLVVGVMVLVGLFVQPLWWLALLAGCGMMLAGLTNTCMLAVVLGKLPWNATRGDTSPTQCQI